MVVEDPQRQPATHAALGRVPVWSAARSMGVARFGHTATSLPNGKVLVAGGSYRANAGRLARAELFDPATGRWKRLA